MDPTVSPYGIFSVHTAKGMPHLALYGVLTTYYVNDPLLSFQIGRLKSKLIADRVATEIGIGFGLFDRLDIAVSLPVYWRQKPENFSGVSQGSTGIGMIRLMIKGTILQNEKFLGFGIAAIAEAAFPTGKRGALMGETTIHATPRLVFDYRWRGFVVAVNIGYRIRKRVTYESLVIDDELWLGVGTEIPLYRDMVSLVGELNMNFAVGKGVKRTADVPMEVLSALRVRPLDNLVLSLGAGFGVTAGPGTPDFRVLFSIGWGFNFQKKRTFHPPRKIVHKGPLAPVFVKVDVPPFTPRKPIAQPKFDKVTITDGDYDGDGIPNSKDKCPYEPEDHDGFEDLDGCPDLDNDRDGIPDLLDKCPMLPETINGVDDEDGCPDKGKARVFVIGNQIVINDRVFFDTGSDVLRPVSHKILDQVASTIKANWQMRKILVEGHTDNVGDFEMNVDLSERRAQRVALYLITKGVAKKRLVAKGFGPKRPVATNDTDEGKQKNRRVAFTIVTLAKIKLKLKPAPTKGGGK